MNKSFVMLLLGTIMLSITGCTPTKRTNSYSNKPEYKQVSDNGVTVSNDIAEEINRKILINLTGYEKNAPKKLLLKDKNVENTIFEIIDVNNNEVVFKGQFSEVKNDICLGDFSSYSKAGTYYVEVDGVGHSEQFIIEDGLYEEILSERLSHFTENEAIPEEYSKENVSKSYIRIADRILADQLFRDSIVTSDANIMSKPVMLAYAEIDTLSSYINDDGSLKSKIVNNLTEQYQYAAVFALFSDGFRQYDKEYSNKCMDIAIRAYDYAEEEYSKLSDSKEMLSIADKRFWAAAQLFKLTGKNNYLSIAEGYSESNLKGFSEKNCGYLGMLAYLTSPYKSDLDICRKYMNVLMDDAISVASSSEENEYLVENIDEYGEDTIINAFSNARLMMLANYISKSIIYIRGTDNQLSFLYGRNPSETDYAYSMDSEYYDEPQEFILAGIIDSYVYDERRNESN